MASLFEGVQLEKRDGSKHSASVLDGKIVGVYFSAHWCPPCRMFTPILKAGNFEIVFVSFDRSESDLKKYMEEAHGDWYHVPFGTDKIQELSGKFGVSGIPALIVVKPDGTMITKEGRQAVQGSNPRAALSKWMA